MNDISEIARQANERHYATLVKTLVEAQDLAVAHPTRTNIAARDAAKRSLAEYEKQMAAENETGESFESVLAVHAYLMRGGYRCSASTLYNHVNRGLLLPGKAGRFNQEAVDQYAARWLRLADSGTDDDDDDLDTRKKRAETRKADAQAVSWETRTARETGEVIDREDVGRIFAGRIAVLRSDLENGVQRLAPELVKMLDGGDDMIPEVVDHLKAWSETMIGRYAEDIEIPVPNGKRLVVTVDIRGE